jgi:acetolactate synthase-1/2/3 large subunit
MPPKGAQIISLIENDKTENQYSLKVSDYVMDFIFKRGVKDIFLIPGGGCIHLVDSLGRHDGLNYICNLHEQASGVAAEAYAQYSNNLGVALVTTGPGSTNVITAVAAAWLDSTPLMIISGQVQQKDMINGRGTRQIGFQEIQATELVKDITKYAALVDDPKYLRYHFEKAFHEATSGRPGPVWLDIPLDIQAARVDIHSLLGYSPSLEKPRITQEIIDSLIDEINSAERPVLLVGNGVRLAKCEDQLTELVDILKIPVLTTWKAIDLFAEDHPCFAGRPGIAGQRGANFTQQNADLIITIGARLDHGQTAYQPQNFARAAVKVIVDIDPYEIRKMGPVEYPLCVDAGEFVSRLLERKMQINNDNRDWLATTKEWQQRYPVVLDEYWAPKDLVNNYAFIDALSDLMSPGDLLIPGSSGACSEVTMQAFKVKEGMRIFNSEGLGPMGFGIAASMGGCIAAGRQPTVCVDGDGGFFMNVQELEVVRREKLPIKFFVLNNDGYVSIRNTQNKHFGGHQVASGPDSGCTLPDIKKTAACYGIKYYCIDSHDELRKNMKLVLNYKGPAICEVKMPPTQETSPRTAAYKKKDGSFASRPMEDMCPFLDRGEFEENMFVEILEDE